MSNRNGDQNGKFRKLTTASGKPYTENENSMSVGPRGPILLQIINRQLCHFFRTDFKLGSAVAKALGVDVEVITGSMKHSHASVGASEVV